MNWILLAALLILPGKLFAQTNQINTRQLDKLMKTLDTRPVDEILGEFRSKTEKFRACTTQSDCVLERAECRSYGVNRNNLKPFRNLSSKLQITCGGTTKCKAVACENKLCQPLECFEGSI